MAKAVHNSPYLNILQVMMLMKRSFLFCKKAGDIYQLGRYCLILFHHFIDYTNAHSWSNWRSALVSPKVCFKETGFQILKLCIITALLINHASMYLKPCEAFHNIQFNYNLQLPSCFNIIYLPSPGVPFTLQREKLMILTCTLMHVFVLACCNAVMLNS